MKKKILDNFVKPHNNGYGNTTLADVLAGCYSGIKSFMQEVYGEKAQIIVDVNSIVDTVTRACNEELLNKRRAEFPHGEKLPENLYDVKAYIYSEDVETFNTNERWKIPTSTFCTEIVEFHIAEAWLPPTSPLKVVKVRLIAKAKECETYTIKDITGNITNEKIKDGISVSVHPDTNRVVIFDESKRSEEIIIFSSILHQHHMIVSVGADMLISDEWIMPRH